MAAFPQLFQKQSQLTQIFIPNAGRFGHDAQRTLQINEPHRAIKLKTEFIRMQQLEKGQVMLLKTQMLKAIQERFQITKKI